MVVFNHPETFFMKYLVKVIGQEMHITAHSIDDAQAAEVQVYAEENDEQLWEISGEISPETLPDYDAWNTNMWVLDKPSDDKDAQFVVEDEAGEMVCEFTLADIRKAKKPAGETLYAMPGEHGAANVLLCVSSSKGTVCDYSLESKDRPEVQDFSYIVGNLVTPAGKGTFLDKLLYKGTALEIGYDSQDTDNIGVTSQLFLQDQEEE